MKNIFAISIIAALLLISIIPASYATIMNHNQYGEQSHFAQQLESSEGFKDTYDYDHFSLMTLDFETFKKWEEDYSNAQKAYINPDLNNTILTTASYSILDLLDYVPAERDQNWCGNCWAWPATGVMGIALYVQEDIFNRLSVQYINSCGYHVGVDCCEGGTLDIFCRFYRFTDMAIPWSNENADWKDKYEQCDTPCESISITPNYPISSIYPLAIETHEIPEDEAISNVKNILHQEKGVYFSWYLPDMEYRQDFSDFWSSKSEDYIYDLDWDCGAEFLDDEGGGHAVLCVGYNDDEGTNNDYWIMLNSWGTPYRRPNGLFAVNMHMDYDCNITFEGHEYYSFNFQTINVTFGSEEEAPDAPIIEGLTTGQTNTEYDYLISAVDHQGDDVYFYVDWGDDTTEGWLGPVNSGEQFEVSHTWKRRGDYIISVKARDTNSNESLWSTLEVSMPKNKQYIDMFFLRFLEHHSRMFPILRQLLELQ